MLKTHHLRTHHRRHWLFSEFGAVYTYSDLLTYLLTQPRSSSLWFTESNSATTHNTVQSKENM